MLKFDEACKQLGYVRGGCPIEEDAVFYAYKNGEAHTFSTAKEAKAFSSFVERFVKNAAERTEWFAAQRILEAQVYQLCYDSLKIEWTTPIYAGDTFISEDLFDLCYSEAYERGHSGGIDEVANYMYGIVEFAQKVLAIK